MKKVLLILILIISISCRQNSEVMEKPYVIEVTTFQYKPTVNASDYWKEDAKVAGNYTSKQPGFIRRESGYSKEKNEVVVVVYWQTNEDAQASMQKFMKDSSVAKFVNMIAPSTMRMDRYTVQ